MDKRGQGEVIQLNTIFEVLAAIVVGSFFVLAAVGFNQFTKFDKLYLEEDAKLLVNTMLASPGEVAFNYTYAKMYDISIKENEVSVLKNLRIQDLKSTHSLVLTKKGPPAQLEGKVYG